MVDPAPGWSSSPFAGGLTPNDAWSRRMHMRYGGRTDDIIAYQENEEGLMGRARPVGGGSSSGWLGSGSVNVGGRGGNTPSDPGGYHYNTLANTIGGAAGMVKWGFNTRNKNRKQKELDLKKTTRENTRMENAQKLQKTQDLGNMANKYVKTSRDLQAGNFAKSTKFEPGVSSSAPAQGINLLTGPGAFPSSFFNSSTTPKKP